jgi:hypothetical protein
MKLGDLIVGQVADETDYSASANAAIAIYAR